jgi:phosphoglycerate dehydrogenase-like enzyme
MEQKQEIRMTQLNDKGRSRLNAVYILDEVAFGNVYGPDEQRDIADRVNVLAPPYRAATIQNNPSLLKNVDVVFSSWGMVRLDDAILQAAPRLKAVFYGAGSVKNFVTEAFWKREVALSSAWGANAVPVSEYTLAAILFSLKQAFRSAQAYRQRRNIREIRQTIPGAYGTTVGLVSMGMIGRLVRERLHPFEVKVLAYDPFLSPADAEKLGVTLVPLDVLFKESDVVSLHTPWLKETEGMITGEHFEKMKPGATFINTARGAVVKEPEMIEVLTRRQDLFAVLDVTYPEPPVADSPLLTLPNVMLTPHIAGSVNRECRRMGRTMIEELDRYLAGQPLRWQVTEAKAAFLA